MRFDVTREKDGFESSESTGGGGDSRVHVSFVVDAGGQDDTEVAEGPREVDVSSIREHNVTCVVVSVVGSRPRDDHTFSLGLLGASADVYGEAPPLEVGPERVKQRPGQCRRHTGYGKENL